jgi:hypothetical protein
MQIKPDLSLLEIDCYFERVREPRENISEKERQIRLTDTNK